MQIIREKLKAYPEIASLLLFIVGALIVTYFVNNYFAIFAPFIIAYVVTMSLRQLMLNIRSKIKIPNALNTILCMIIFITIAAFVVWLVAHYLVDGVAYLINLLSTGTTIDTMVVFVNEVWGKLSGILAFINIEISMNDISSMVSEFAKNAITILSNFSITLASKIPSLLMSMIIGCVAAFYMLSDYEKISDAIKSHLSPKTRRFVDVFNHQALSSFTKMILSYILVSCICFIELMIGLLILGIDNTPFISLIIAILDVLPVLGSGVVLIPWGIIALLLGDTVTGVGILVLYVIITIVRQIVEPRIVGSQIGLYPLITIMSLFVGLKLMGGVGLVVGPLYVIVWKSLSEEGLLPCTKRVEMSSNEGSSNVTSQSDTDNIV